MPDFRRELSQLIALPHCRGETREQFLSSTRTAWGEEQEDRGAEGQRDRETEGQRDRETEGQRSTGMLSFRVKHLDLTSDGIPTVARQRRRGKPSLALARSCLDILVAPLSH